MKLLIPICIVGILLVSGFGAVGEHVSVNEQNVEDLGRLTHTVFAEDATATWCGYCHYAREALDKIYTSGDYPFYYVCMVDDKNTHAAARNLEYNVYGFPTVFFDGGYKVAVGGGTGNEAQYRSYITQCGSRTVKDIDITLDVEWLGDATMDISVSVLNNEATQYDGRIRVYVTEVESSLNWKDTAGHPYTFPFLDYAFNEVISISSGGTWSDSISWDGHDYNNGMGTTYSSIQYGNIEVIAAVFNSEWHQGYAYPPSQNPFDAYYVDDTAGVFVGDTAPYTPSNPNPADGATGVDTNKDLSWTGGGPPGTTITYDVYFGTASNPPLVASGQSGTTYDPGAMGYETTYYWKIVSWDDQGHSTEGPIWDFTTIGSPNNAPAAPEISGPAKGKPNVEYTYTIVSTDSDGDQISYYVDWDDGTNSGWSTLYNSGDAATLTHTWTAKDTYVINAKVKDAHGAESAWTTFQVSIPRSITLTNPLLVHLIDQYLHDFPILRTLLGI